MRIALWADNVLDRNMSGMGFHQAELLRAIDRLDGRDSYTVFYTPRHLGQAFPLRMQRIATQALPGLRHFYYPSWHTLAWPRVDPFLPRVDLVHLLHASVSVPTAHPAIVWVVDLASRVMPEAYPRRRRLFKDRALRRAARNPMVWFTANSEFVKHQLCSLYDVAPERVTVVHLGVNQEHFRRIVDDEVLDEVRARYRLNRPFFLFVGLFSPRKNLEPLIRGVAEFNRQTAAGYQLVLVGASGWKDEGIRRAADESGCVHLTGYLPDADLPALYSLASALVFPSSYEGFGLPLIEAMACGTPVVASKLTSIPEVVGNAALLLEEVTPSEIARCLRRLVEEPELAPGLRRRGLVRVAGMTWESAARKCQAMYAQVLGASR